MVRMVIMYDRTNPTQEPQPGINMFQQAGANTGFFNDLTDLWRPYNTDRYRILTTRTFKLGYASNNGTGAQPGFQNLANNDFKMACNFRINLTKYYRSTSSMMIMARSRLRAVSGACSTT